MNTAMKLANFAGYLLQNDPAIFEVFKDPGSLILYQDRDNPELYNFGILMGKEYYTQEQGEKLFAHWKTYQAQPQMSR